MNAATKATPHTVDTWLPVFPGFYGTLFEPDDESTGDEMTRALAYECDPAGRDGDEKLFDMLTAAKIDPYRFAEFDNAAYETAVSSEIVDAVNGELCDIPGAPVFTFQTVKSPREYNFTNDSINVQLDFTDRRAFAAHLLRTIRGDRDGFKKYLSRYTSRSGFMSFYSDDPALWIKEIREGFALSDGHKAGALVDFLLAGEGFDSEALYDCVSEAIYAGEYVSCTADPAALKALVSAAGKIMQGLVDYARYCKAMAARPARCVEHQYELMTANHEELIKAIA